MRKTLTALLLVAASTVFAQKADFQAAEKYSAANLTQKVGDLSVNPQWIE